MPSPPRRLPGALVRAVALAALVTSACSFDEAALLQPGADRIDADEGQIRVLRYRDEPTDGDQWIDVLRPDGGLVEETASFREEDALDAAPDEDADVRRVFAAVGPGRTLLVELNCVGCRDGVPDTAPAAELHVWDFVVEEATPFVLDPTAARADVPTRRPVGEHVVVVREAVEGPATVRRADPPLIVPVASHQPDDGADVFVDVYATVAAGSTELVYELRDGRTVRYPVLVSG